MGSFKTIILFSFICFSGMAQTPPLLKTKQDLKNIRFISHDGKFTYYQQRSGHLQMSTNYSNQLVMEKPKGTYYHVAGSQDRRKLVIEVIPEYFQHNDFRKNHEIYTVNFGDIKTTFIDKGRKAQLHLKDAWISYFKMKEQTIHLKHLSSEKKYKIQLNNKINPYFTPTVYMLTNDTIVYTDINKKGYMALMMYSLLEKKFTPVFKGTYPGTRLDLCIIKDDIYLGEFSYDTVEKGTSILKIPIYNNKNFKKVFGVYSSQLADIGHLTCTEDSLYFIKLIEKNDTLNLKKTEVVKIKLKDFTTKTMTNLEYVTNILNMDGNILVPYRGNYYVIQGLSNLNQDELKDKK